MDARAPDAGPAQSALRGVDQPRRAAQVDLPLGQVRHQPAQFGRGERVGAGLAACADQREQAEAALAGDLGQLPVERQFRRAARRGRAGPPSRLRGAAPRTGRATG